MKNQLVDKIAIFLLREGFIVKTLSRGCFDLLARKKERIILIKALEDANSILEEYVSEMDRISAYVGAVPLIVAEKAGGKLEDNVLYTRFGTYTLTPKTFISCINNKFPFVRRTQAGLTARINTNELKEQREQKGLSLNNISKKMGVSSRMMAKYESGMAEITLPKAQKLHSFFGSRIFQNINIFTQKRKHEDSHSSLISKKYVRLGFEASDTKNTPFDIIAKKGHEIILTEVGDKSKPDLASLSNLLNADKLVIYKKKKPRDLPAITKNEFLEFEEANDLIKFLKEF